MSAQRALDEILRFPADEPSDHSLLWRSREGDQDAATQLYLRYAERLSALVARQCSTDLASRAGVEDIVQSVFGSFFRRIGQGSYDVPDGDELWKLLLVIALHKIREKAAYHHAAKRNAHRTIGGDEAGRHLESRSRAGESQNGYLEIVVDEILGLLPARSRVMVRLRIEGYEVAEVARKTGRSRRTVERVLQETRLKMVQLVREENRDAADGDQPARGGARRLHSGF
jgi:RNA polymerase sigma-70 factor, ECF subfamily